MKEDYTKIRSKIANTGQPKKIIRRIFPGTEMRAALILAFISFIGCQKASNPHASTTSSPQPAVVIANDVRVREQPSINGKIVSVLKKNEAVIILETVVTDDPNYREWYRVDAQDNSGRKKVGYVFSGFIKLQELSGSIFTKDRSARIDYRGSEAKIFNTKANRILKTITLNGQIEEKGTIIQFDPPYLLVRIVPITAATPEQTVSGVINIESGDWIELGDRDAFICAGITLSPSKRYLAVDNGTSIDRGLIVLDLQTRKKVLETEYMDQIKWMKDDELQYFQGVIDGCKEVKVPPLIEVPYIRRLVLWDHNKETVLKDCIPGDRLPSL